MSPLHIMVACLSVVSAKAGEPPKPDPRQPVDYVKWLNEEFSKDIAENAADLYDQALGAFQANEEARKLATEVHAKEWSDSQRRQLQEWVAVNGACLEKYAAAARKPGCYFTLHSQDASVINLMLPETSTVRDAARLTACRARLRLLDGDVNGAMEDVATLLQAGRHMRSQPMLIQYLVGLAIGAQAYDVLLDFPRPAIGPLDYAQGVASLKRFDREPDPPLRQLAVEKLMAWDCAQRFMRDTDGDGRLEHLKTPEAISGRDVLIRPQTLDEILAQADGLFADLGEMFAAGDYLEHCKRAAALEKRMAELKGTLLGVLVPDLSRTALLQRRLVAQRRACRIVFELHAYYAKNRRWPADLNEALPKSVAGQALDPFSGKPFGYRLEAGQPFLYSVGQDAADGGGQVFRKEGKVAWGDTGDFVFWPRQE